MLLLLLQAGAGAVVAHAPERRTCRIVRRVRSGIVALAARLGRVVQ